MPRPTATRMMVAAEAGTFVINPSLHAKDKLAYDVERDFVPITGLIRIHHSVMVGPSLKADNVAEIIELARKKPGEITYGTAGIGSGPPRQRRALRERGEHQAGPPSTTAAPIPRSATSWAAIPT